MHAGEFEGHPHQFALVAEKFGKGHVNRKNLADVWKRELKARKVRRRNDPATIPQRSRNDPATMSLTEPPVLPPLQGQRSVSAPPQTAAKAEQPGEALKNCLDAASTAFTAREVSGWCMCRRSCMSLAHLQLTLLRRKTAQPVNRCCPSLRQMKSDRFHLREAFLRPGASWTRQNCDRSQTCRIGCSHSRLGHLHNA